MADPKVEQQALNTSERENNSTPEKIVTNEDVFTSASVVMNNFQEARTLNEENLQQWTVGNETAFKLSQEAQVKGIEIQNEFKTEIEKVVQTPEPLPSARVKEDVVEIKSEDQKSMEDGMSGGIYAEVSVQTPVMEVVEPIIPAPETVKPEVVSIITETPNLNPNVQISDLDIPKEGSLRLKDIKPEGNFRRDNVFDTEKFDTIDFNSNKKIPPLALEEVVDGQDEQNNSEVKEVRDIKENLESNKKPAWLDVAEQVDHDQILEGTNIFSQRLAEARYGEKNRVTEKWRDASYLGIPILKPFAERLNRREAEKATEKAKSMSEELAKAQGEREALAKEQKLNDTRLTTIERNKRELETFPNISDEQRGGLLNDLSKEEETLRERNEVIDKKLHSLDQDLALLEAQTKTIEQVRDRAVAMVEKMAEQKLAPQKQELAVLDSEIKSHIAQIQKYKNDIADIVSTKASLAQYTKKEKQLVGFDKQITIINDKIKTIKGKIGSRTMRFAQLGGTIKQIETETESFNSYHSDTYSDSYQGRTDSNDGEFVSDDASVSVSEPQVEIQKPERPEDDLGQRVVNASSQRKPMPPPLRAEKEVLENNSQPVVKSAPILKQVPVAASAPQMNESALNPNTVENQKAVSPEKLRQRQVIERKIKNLEGREQKLNAILLKKGSPLELSPGLAELREEIKKQKNKLNKLLYPNAKVSKKPASKLKISKK